MPQHAQAQAQPKTQAIHTSTKRWNDAATSSEQDDAARATFLLEDIRLRALLPPDVHPRDALRAVMCTFAQHVSGHEARELWEELPNAIQPMLGLCMLHRSEEPRAFDRDSLLLRVADHLEISKARAEEITSAVLHAVSSHLPAREIQNVAQELPEDLRSLWVVPHNPPLAAPVDPHPILSPIEATTDLPEGVTGEGAFEAVMLTLSRCLRKGDAHVLFQSIPADLRGLIEPELDNRQDDRPEQIDCTGFLELVAATMRMDGDATDAEPIVRAVFRAVQERLPSTTIDHVTKQLPKRLAEIWALPEA